MIVRTALFRMIVSRALALVLMATGLAVLGRLLSPEAFGHFALAMAIFGLAQTMVQFGLRQYIIRSEEELPRTTMEAAAGLSMMMALAGFALLLGIALAFGGWLLPAPAAWALVPLAAALLVGPIVLGTEALLQRSLRFGLISVVEVIRVATDVAVAITLALMGFGAVALACGTLAAHLAVGVILLLWAGREDRVRPRIMGGRALRRGLAGWGSTLTTVQMLPQTVDLAMVAALSSAQGAAALGLFNRARVIHQILDRTVFEGIKPVILPAFSSALRNGTSPAELYRLKIDYMSAICWPGFALIALMAEPLVAVLLGPQWDEAVPVVRILALMGLVLPITKMSQSLFVALDETAVYLRLQLVQLFVRLPLALAGALVSVEAFAAAYVAGDLVKALGITLYLRRRLDKDGPGHRPLVLRSAGMTFLALPGPAAILYADLGAEMTLLLALPLAALGWLLGALAMRHPLFGEIRWMAINLRRAVPRRMGRG
jgi:O-antigen/teichoic acid export membrane protein